MFIAVSVDYIVYEKESVKLCKISVLNINNDDDKVKYL